MFILFSDKNLFISLVGLVKEPIDEEIKSNNVSSTWFSFKILFLSIISFI
ncbi:hypothetical protein mmcaprivi_08890 [Mycoplasma mycoides]|nr:hypothetical protein mmcaprivi_08890 [Mycoplasma mycoides]